MFSPASNCLLNEGGKYNVMNLNTAEWPRARPNWESRGPRRIECDGKRSSEESKDVKRARVR